jgi:hypothetical protein
MDQDVNTLISKLKVVNPNNPDSQWDACIRLGDIAGAANDKEVVDVLIEALGPQNFALTRAHAAEALGKLGVKQASEKLKVSLKDPYRLVRSYSARALGKLKDVDAVQALRYSYENDEFFGVRAEAAEALGEICSDNVESEECKEALKTLAMQILVKKQEEENRTKEDPSQKKREKSEATKAYNKISKVLNEADESIDSVIAELKELSKNKDISEEELQKRLDDITEKSKRTKNGVSTTRIMMGFI